MNAPAANPDYAGYVEWKNWTQTFEYGPEDALYFRGETRGLAIANGQILEIGFGTGAFLAWAINQGASVAGVEIIDQMCVAARDRGVELLPAAFETIAGDHAGRFDAILAFDVFEHLERDAIREKLAACHAMLKPGGHLLLRFPNGQSPFGLVCQHGDPTHRTALSSRVLEQLAAGTTFEVVRYRPQFRIYGANLPRAVVRACRYAMRSLIAFCLNLIYSQSIPWDTVVTLVMRKKPVDPTPR